MEVQSDGGDVVSSEQLVSTVVDHDPVSVSAGEAAASDIGEGTILSHRYLLTKRMASGGTCDVYQARDLVALGVASGDQSFLAVKLLRADLVEAVGEAGLVLNEALLTRQLNHPSVIKIFDYHCDQSGPTDRHFVTMELVEGETLAELLGRTPGRRLGYWHAMAILEPVASALQAAHESGIVHSDIKPGNILIGHDGQVKIIDFGTARGIKHALKGKPWRKGRQTSHATVEVAEDRPYLAFTHEYASKDVINEVPPAPADDVYSLACVLYEALSGQKPAADDLLGPDASLPLPSDEDVESDDDMTILGAIAPGQDVAAQEGDSKKWRKPRGLNLAQWWVLRKGLSDHKKDRYASVDAFVKAFKKAKKLPVKLMAAVVLIPCLVFGYTGIQERYAAHQTEVETWAQSDMQLVQATQYADLVMQAPVTSLPKVLSDLSGLPGLLRSGVLANAALSNFDRVENHIRDRLAYNALALSAIGVTLEQAETALKALQRTNAEFVDYVVLLKLLSDLSVYYPDSFRLVEMRERVSSAQQAESQALSSQWSMLWESDLEPERIERIFQTGSRLLVVGIGQKPLTLSEDALSAYENAVKHSALVNNANGDARLKALYKLMGLFADDEKTASVLEKIWAPYTEAVLGKSKPYQALPSEAAPDMAKSTQQAALAEQLFFVANIWSDADLMSAKTQLNDALATVDLALASPEAKLLIRALVERIELKISYYKSTDKSVSTQRLSDLRDTLSALL